MVLATSLCGCNLTLVGEGHLRPSPPQTRKGNMDITLTEIRITRKIREDGQQIFSVTLDKEFSFVEALGLLEAAKWDIHQRMIKTIG